MVRLLLDLFKFAAILALLYCPSQLTAQSTGNDGEVAPVRDVHGTISSRRFAGNSRQPLNRQGLDPTRETAQSRSSHGQKSDLDPGPLPPSKESVGSGAIPPKTKPIANKLKAGWKNKEASRYYEPSQGNASSQEPFANENLISKLGIKPINELDVNTEIDPSETAATDDAAAYFDKFRHLEYEPGGGIACRWHQYGPTAADFCYQPLFWEEVNLERHGRSAGLFQPAVSATRFFGTLPLLPFKLKKQPPFRRVGKSSPFPAGLPAPKVKEFLPCPKKAAGRVNLVQRPEYYLSQAKALPILADPIGWESIGQKDKGAFQITNHSESK